MKYFENCDNLFEYLFMSELNSTIKHNVRKSYIARQKIEIAKYATVRCIILRTVLNPEISR